MPCSPNDFALTTAPKSNETIDSALRKIARSLGVEGWGTNSIQTAATGPNWTPLLDIPADEVMIVNRSGTTLEYRRADRATTPMPLVDAASVAFRIEGNCNEVEIRRTDLSGTQVTVNFQYRRGA